MNAIVVVDKNWAIGKDNGLLVHLPGDLKHFKEMTLGKVVVMGRKTLASLPGGKPLPGRTTLVLSASLPQTEDYRVFASKEELLEELKSYNPETIFISGGETVYREFEDACDRFYITKMNRAFEADRHFPNLDEKEHLYIEEESQVMAENGVEYRFITYKRK